ncbi:MAG TPA: aminotransferase class IV, partial [Propionibacteriaceae bacterium]|nr:aminotransferase class IV [Propionibacteriaceae bacterium]
GLAELDLERLRAGVRAVLDADIVREGRLRVSVTDTVQVITVMPLTTFHPVSTSVTVPWRRNERGALAGVKSLSFGEALVAQRWLRPLGADEGLLGNTAGDVCEGVTSNVFVVLDGLLRTPPLASGCLDGVTREILCEALDVDDTPIPLEAMAEVSEAFWTSATRKVQPIGCHDGRDLQVGDVTRLAIETLASWVG